MKIALFSDLHLENAAWKAPFMDVDVAVCVGDVCNWPGDPHPAIDFLSQLRGPKHTIFVPGNHDFAGRHYESALLDMRGLARRLGIHLLHEDEVVIESFRFLGTPLFSAMCDLGRQRRTTAWNYHATSRKEFSGRNQCLSGPWTPAWMSARRRRAVNWLESRMSAGSRHNTIVCSHWAPGPMCLSDEFKGIDTSSYYHGNAEHLLGGARWWMHGHVHQDVDMHIRGCRVLCHPRGRTDAPYRPLLLDLAQDQAIRNTA